jgi:hypothetical protein
MKLLVPGMITYIASVAATSDEPEKQQVHVAATEEILKAFSALVPTVSEASRMSHIMITPSLIIDNALGPAILGIFLPTVALLLDPSKAVPSTVHTQAVANLLNFATGSPAAFKEVTGKLDQTVRDALETSIRQAVSGNKAPQQSTVAKPQISLRSF